MKAIIRTAAAALTLGYASASPAQLTVYAVEAMSAQELDFGGVDAEAHDINDLNEVVGWVNDPGNNPELPRAVFYKNGTATWIMDQGGYYNTHAHGINNSSRVVGAYQDPYQQPATPHAFYWNAATSWFKELSTQPYRSDANAINDAGLIAGNVKANIGCNGQDDLPVTWEIVSGWPGVDLDIPFCPPSLTSALHVFDVNEAGAMTGWKENGPGSGARAFRWNGSSLVNVPLPAGASETFGAGINETGAVVGSVTFYPETGTSARGFFWNGTSANIVVLGTLPGGDYSYASEVNDLQFVAGSSEHEFPFSIGGITGTIARVRAYIWHAHFGLKALPIPAGFSSYGAHCYANALSNLNWFAGGYIRVVGYCTNSQNQKRPVRWTVKIVKDSFPIPTPL
jgi:uncharacterized membrane protein